MKFKFITGLILITILVGRLSAEEKKASIGETDAMQKHTRASHPINKFDSREDNFDEARLWKGYGNLWRQSWRSDERVAEGECTRHRKALMEWTSMPAPASLK